MNAAVTATVHQLFMSAGDYRDTSSCALKGTSFWSAAGNGNVFSMTTHSASLEGRGPPSGSEVLSAGKDGAGRASLRCWMVALI